MGMDHPVAVVDDQLCVRGPAGLRVTIGPDAANGVPDRSGSDAPFA